jgi:ATP-dependent DNA helicase RecQ
MQELLVTPKEALHTYFGFETFKGDQEKIIQSVLDGKNTFVIMPTGGGKSLCYQLPALMLDGTAIIVSPLIALMKNQVDAIRSVSENDSIAHFLNSSLNKTESNQVKSDIKAGKTKLLYVAPESLTKQENIDFFHSIKISFFAIDEAHCISEWGHDFRPEYRKLKPMIEAIDDVPIIALTATATEKVQVDIQKNLGMLDANLFKDSFNRSNLYYEVRPKKNVQKEIIKFIKQRPGKSGIIYCLSRKKVEELAQLLTVNGIKALPYHAGLDATSRGKHQDMFLMEDVDVIVATIAFGMGIDKPDVRFVIHHDIPKSLESYYQETGRAGRDGGEGHCVAYYSYKDIEKLEKFLQGKPVAEQEIGHQLLSEVVSYAETSMNRRQFILHYFGEEFDIVNGEGADMCDNSRFPKKRVEGKEDMVKVLKAVKEIDGRHKMKYFINLLLGKLNAEIKGYKHNLTPHFGVGSEKEESYWSGCLRQGVVDGLIGKDIESYGTLFITEKGLDFIKNPTTYMVIEQNDFSDTDQDDDLPLITKPGSNSGDETLFAILKDLRKKVAKEKGVPPFVVFQDPSLEDMSIQYPITMDEMQNIAGVGAGKAKRYGQPFIDVINKYVEENEIDRPQDLIVKSVVNKSGLKVNIIMNIDKKIPLDIIAKGIGKDLNELLTEIEGIVSSGTKINIDYFINDRLDEESVEEIYDYFMETETDCLEDAFKEFGGDFSEEDIRMVRLKFVSEMGN